MTVKPVIFDNILFGDLAPWRKENSEEKRFRDILNNQIRVNKDNPEQFFIALSNALKEYSITLKIDHLPNKEKIANLVKFAELQTDFSKLSIPIFYNKVAEFYNYLIQNECIRIRAAIATTISKSKTNIDSEYQVVSLLRNLEYTIEQIALKTNNDKISVYVLNAVKLSLFSLYEEIKIVFPDFIGSEALTEYEIINAIVPDFETNKTTPDTLAYTISQFLINKDKKKEIITIEIKESNKKHSLSGKEYNSFTYKHLTHQIEYIKDLYDALKTHKFIDKDTVYTDFKKVFTGDKITKPVIWTGNISELNYFIKLIHNINKSVVDLKQNHWLVACKCFINPDGSFFDRANLKEQKTPKLTALILENVAMQLK